MRKSSGREFTAFVPRLYNAAGVGEAIDTETKTPIAAINKPTEFKIPVIITALLTGTAETRMIQYFPLKNREISGKKRKIIRIEKEEVLAICAK